MITEFFLIVNRLSYLYLLIRLGMDGGNAANALSLLVTPDFILIMNSHAPVALIKA